MNLSSLTPAAKRNALLFCSIALSLPDTAAAYVTWGDFHVFAVIFFSFLGGFLGLVAIFGAIYFACGKQFLNRHQQEVAQTHREHHPWPIGSARWRLQQMIKTKRRDGETRFPSQKAPIQFRHSSCGEFTFAPSTGYYRPTAIAAPMSFYQRAVDYCNANNTALDRKPIIDATQLGGEYYGVSMGFDRPTYFTPSVEKHMVPTHEEFEEYRVVREESFVSSTGGGVGNATIGKAEDVQISTIGPNTNVSNTSSGTTGKAEDVQILTTGPNTIVSGTSSGAGMVPEVNEASGVQLMRTTHTTTTTTRTSRRKSPQTRIISNTYI